MRTSFSPRGAALLFGSLLLAAGVGGCSGVDETSADIVDTPSSAVERQSIGNCWIYAESSWVEALHLAATGEEFDNSQSYWTYWHWYDQITGGASEIETGGNEYVAKQIIAKRGLVSEKDFIVEDTLSEMSGRQSAALARITIELKTGRLATPSARKNRKLVRQVLDDAWQLDPSVRKYLDKAFGTTGSKTFLGTASKSGTPILRSKDFTVRYTERKTDPAKPTVKDTSLQSALDEWSTQDYPSWGSASSKRSFQIRVQRAMHDKNPVVITWMVDFNAMESSDPKLAGSFNMTTLGRAGRPGRQGGHMTVLEDYQAKTKDFGVLAAGVTLDPSKLEDQKKLDAALLPSTEIQFFRIKNSWGAFRDDRASAPGMPGFHDLYMDYLNGPITWCPSVEGVKDEKSCTGSTSPWENVVLPPGY